MTIDLFSLKDGRKKNEFQIDENETNLDVISLSATNYLFQCAEKEAKEFIENDEAFKNLRDFAK